MLLTINRLINGKLAAPIAFGAVGICPDVNSIPLMLLSSRSHSSAVKVAEAYEDSTTVSRFTNWASVSTWLCSACRHSCFQEALLLVLGFARVRCTGVRRMSRRRNSQFSGFRLGLGGQQGES